MQFITCFKRFIRTYCLLFALGLLLVSTSDFGQSSTTHENSSQSYTGGRVSGSISSLTIGDKVPDITFDSVLNYPSNTAKVSDFKSKLTILDFWSSSCTACIDYFPHMQSLKNEFKKNLQIILVNSKSALWHDNETKIKRVLQNVQSCSGVAIRLPVIFNCAQLDDYFPSSTLPQEVWINDKGVVIAITDAEEVTPDNIKAILDGKKVNLVQKYYLPFDITAHPLAELVYGIHASLFNNTLFSSLLIKGYINGLGGILGVRHADSPSTRLYTGWYAVNMPLLAIYASAYRDKFKFPSNQVLVETRDSALFRKTTGYYDTAYSRYYSYDITVPPVSFEKLMADVQGDLERTFHATVVNARRKISCFVVKATAQSKKSYSKGGKMEYRMGRLDAQKCVRNIPMVELVSNLNLTYFNIPLIDETGLTRNVDIDMPNELTQQNIVRTLEKAGFIIKKEERDMNVAAIVDK